MTAPQKPGAAAKQSAKVAPKRVVSDEQESSVSDSLSASGDKSTQGKSSRVATQLTGGFESSSYLLRTWLVLCE